MISQHSLYLLHFTQVLAIRDDQMQMHVNVWIISYIYACKCLYMSVLKMDSSHVWFFLNFPSTCTLYTDTLRHTHTRIHERSHPQHTYIRQKLHRPINLSDSSKRHYSNMQVWLCMFRSGCTCWGLVVHTGMHTYKTKLVPQDFWSQHQSRPLWFTYHDCDFDHDYDCDHDCDHDCHRDRVAHTNACSPSEPKKGKCKDYDSIITKMKALVGINTDAFQTSRESFCSSVPAQCASARQQFNAMCNEGSYGSCRQLCLNALKMSLNKTVELFEHCDTPCVYKYYMAATKVFVYLKYGV